MDASCVASVSASLLGSVLQVSAMLYGRWDEAGKPSAERLLHELSRLRIVLQEIEQSALAVAVPLFLGNLPEVLQTTATLIRQLDGNLRGSGLNTPEANSNAFDEPWKIYDAAQKMERKLTKLEAQAYLARIQHSISSIGNIPELSHGRSVLQRARPLSQTISALWNQRPDYSSAYFNAKSKREPGTGEWILSAPEYKYWARNDGSDNVLQCLGVSGSGKTITASVVVESLKKFSERAIRGNVGVAYFYFNYKFPTSALGLVLALLEQLYVQSWTLATEVLELEERAEKYGNIEVVDVMPVLLSLCSRFHEAYIVIDAPDECPTDFRPELEEILLSFANSRFRFILFSRPDPILKVVQTRPKIQIHPTAQDIRIITMARLDRSPQRGKLSQCAKKIIVDELAQGAAEHGMFLLASLHLDKLLQVTNLEELAVRKQLPALGGTISDAYDDALARISEGRDTDPSLAKTILMCIYHARRPLTARQIFDLISFSLHDHANIKTGTDHQVLLQSCGGFVNENPSNGTICFSHLSVKEYLEKRSEIVPGPLATETGMAKACLEYLLRPEFDPPMNNLAQLQDRVEKFPFYSYAIKHWGSHVACIENKGLEEFVAREKLKKNTIQARHRVKNRRPPTGVIKNPNTQAAHTEENPLRELLAEFLQDEIRLRTSAEAIFRDEIFAFPKYDAPTSQGEIYSTDLHLMAHFGMILSLRGRIRERDQTLLRNSQDWLHRTPLHLAAHRGFVECVNELITIFDLTELDIHQRMAFHYGVLSRNAGPVIRSLASRCKISKIHECRDITGALPIDLAAKKGQLDAVKELLNIGNPPQEALTSALSAALEGGHLGISRLLLAKGVPFDTRHLYRAVISGFFRGVWLLSIHGADINEAPTDGKTAFDLAVTTGRNAMVRDMIPFADMSSTSVVHAIENGNLQALKVLHSTGAFIDFSTYEYPSMLALAASKGMDDIVLYLLHTGLEPQPAMHSALEHGKSSTVKILMQAGAKIENESTDLQSMIEYASVMGYSDLVRLLIDHGVTCPKPIVFDPITKKEKTEESRGSSLQSLGNKKERAVDFERSTPKDPTLTVKHAKAGPAGIKSGFARGRARLVAPTSGFSSQNASISAGSGLQLRFETETQVPAYILLEHTINAEELNLGTIVANPMSPLASFCPAKQSKLKDFIDGNGLSMSVNHFDAKSVVPNISSTMLRSLLGEEGRIDMGVALSAATVVRRSLINFTTAVKMVTEYFQEETLDFMRENGKVYVILGLMQLTSGKVLRTTDCAPQAECSVASPDSKAPVLDGDAYVSRSGGGLFYGEAVPSSHVSGGRKQQSHYETIYGGERIFAIQYYEL